MSSEATVSIKEARYEPYTVLVVCHILHTHLDTPVVILHAAFIGVTHCKFTEKDWDFINSTSVGPYALGLYKQGHISLDYYVCSSARNPI